MLDDHMWEPGDRGRLGLLKAFERGDDYIVYHAFPDHYLREPFTDSSVSPRLAQLSTKAAVFSVPTLATELGDPAGYPDDGWHASVLLNGSGGGAGVVAFIVAYAWPLDPRVAWLERAWVTPDQRGGALGHRALMALQMRFAYELASAGFVGAAGLLPPTDGFWATVMRFGTYQTLAAALREHGIDTDD